MVFQAELLEKVNSHFYNEHYHNFICHGLYDEHSLQSSFRLNLRHIKRR
jgi:hypothetical protein